MPFIGPLGTIGFAAGYRVSSMPAAWADVYPQGAGRIRNAPTSRTAALGIGPYEYREVLR